MPELPDLHTLPAGSHPEEAFRNNGPHDLVLERYKLRELAEGWPCYRDACEWENLRSLFHPDAYVYTTWTGRTHYRDFITASQEGMDNGAFILHRCHGATTDINPEATRAVTKMKATITQRFTIDNCEVDAESDCRFCFFWSRNERREWRAKYVRHWYEKDKMIPVTAGRVPRVDYDQLMQYPSGYRHLAYLQERTMNVEVMKDMPGHLRENGWRGGCRACGENHDLLYRQCKAWVEGKQIDM